ncbi:ly6/PLAUR domain-containing protein 6B-like [Amphibalanus amphitrite]|uniref:ly6/PLAUR domain-containing protein 6B-like n=1 Tax=Amphibalanus amphitrite TaxID=1232801 RepID=UPI001C910557|nr:ly6/PLAUR domain-containing protein 6B-like [Amphibalanus amphitrite]
MRLLLLILLGRIRLGLSGGDSDTTQVPVNPLSCYFCENVQNNYICNRFAIDMPCPPGTEFCRTLHIMDSVGDSVVVNKHCAFADQCRPDLVGCLEQDRQSTCVSCCQAPYCNESVPTNHSNAIIEPGPTAPTRAVTSAGSRSERLPGAVVRSSAALSAVLSLVLLVFDSG